MPGLVGRFLVDNRAAAGGGRQLDLRDGRQTVAAKRRRRAGCQAADLPAGGHRQGLVLAAQKTFVDTQMLGQAQTNVLGQAPRRALMDELMQIGVIASARQRGGLQVGTWPPCGDHVEKPAPQIVHGRTPEITDGR